MPQVIYELKKVVCSYDGTNPVLKIDHLEIIGGQLVVMVGKSGAGKSTILETLGLMNNTIFEGEIIFKPRIDKHYNLSELWTDEKLLSEARNSHMSFIFQNTNLMHNFTAYENACIPMLIQGENINDAILKVEKAMEKVGLKEVKRDDHVTELSGGQRQRLAFVRAITPEFTVLFGDEPTGNLDENNSIELMKVVKKALEEECRTSIIVSHNIDLSLAFADQIIMMIKDKGYGEILEENIFRSMTVDSNKRWIDHHGIEIANLKELLHAKLK
jgi:ABC-type lipoprotein export system ATPase subunit